MNGGTEEFITVLVRQFLTSKGHWVDYKGWQWEAIPRHERRIIRRREPA